MAYRSPTLFQLHRWELVNWLKAKVDSTCIALDQIKAAADAEENARLKADVWPKWVRELEGLREDAETLLAHVHEAEAFELSSEELLSIKRNMRPIEVDIGKIRLSPLEEPDTTARSGYIAMPNPDQNGLIRAANSKKWLGKRQ